MINRRDFALGGLAAPLAPSLAAAAAANGARPGPFMLGADVTWIAEDEAAGAEYFVDGVKRDPFRILRDAGFNYVRLRTFVNPELGYSRREPGNRWGGLEQAVKLAKRVKAAGMGLALSFHYSDTWADPEHQAPPAAWASLTLEEMARRVHEHTRTSLAALRAAGARADMAVIGNETTFGMLWPKGRVALTIPTGNPVTDANHMKVAGVGGYDGFATLLKAGVAGAKAADPAVKIQVHNHLGRHWPIVRNWTDELIRRGVQFDVLGLSAYQQSAEGDWERTLHEFVQRYPGKGVLIAEYSSRKRYVNDITRALPGDRGWGTFIWEPTRHQEAIFDKLGLNAGEGPRPNLIRHGLNSAEAPGGAVPGTPAAAPPPIAPAAAPAPRMGSGGRYHANSFLDEYRRIATAYGLK